MVVTVLEGIMAKRIITISREFGSGGRFMRKINRDVKVVNIDKLEDFEKYVNR